MNKQKRRTSNHFERKEKVKPMSIELTAQKQEIESMPTGEYLGEFINYEEVEGQYGEQLRLTFEIVSPKAYAARTRFVWASKKLSTGAKPSKLWTIVEALYNRKLIVGETVNLDRLIGRQAVLVIVEEAKDDQTFSKVTAIKPYKKQEPMPAPDGVSDDEDPFEEE